MGATGAGKSTFIQYATRENYHGVGHGLVSCTADIVRTKSVSRDGQPVVFIDTPGFDDTYKSDIEILGMIAEFFVKARKDKVNLDTILYLHRISDKRMAGSPLRNLELFASLCGRNAMPRVILVTTMWKHVVPDIGEERERQLKTDFWNDMIAKGSTVARFGDSYDSAWDILAPTDARPQVLLSDEIAEQHKKLKETEVGITLSKQLQRLFKDQQDANRRLKGLAGRQKNPKMAKELENQAEEIEGRLNRTLEQIRALKLSFPTKLMRIFKSKNDTVKVPEAT